jgi:hypothetical protein
MSFRIEIERRAWKQSKINYRDSPRKTSSTLSNGSCANRNLLDVLGHRKGSTWRFVFNENVGGLVLYPTKRRAQLISDYLNFFS